MFNPYTPNVICKEKEVVINSRHLAEFLGKSHKVIFNAIKSAIKADAALAFHFNPATYMLSGGVVRVTSFDVTAEGVELITEEWAYRSGKMKDATVVCLNAFAEVTHYEINEASTRF